MSRLLALGMKVRIKKGDAYVITHECYDGEIVYGSYDVQTKGPISWFEDGNPIDGNVWYRITEYWGQNENSTYTWIPLKNKLF
jgi:hypothetical protein